MDTHYPADSVEFCPHPDALNILACGTYKLDENNGKRYGQCLIYQVQNESQLRLRQKIDLPAVLDMKWCHRSAASPSTLAVADSEGCVSIFEYQNESLLLRDTIQCATPQELCLSLDWSSRRMMCLGSLAVSLSNGCLSVLKPHESAMNNAHYWHAHDFEPWITAWDYWNEDCLYSGGDDLCLKMWDLRQPLTHPAMVNKRFSAGVTTMQCHPHLENLLAVGSYDGVARVFDKRQLTAPITECNVQGGLWRLKWHPFATRQMDLLAACMHDGFKVINFGTTPEITSISDGGPQVTIHFNQHSSLAYGADWSYSPPHQNELTLVASCSFYDHILHLWRG